MPANDAASDGAAERNGHDGPSLHLAVFVEPFLAMLLDGRKTIESRFSLTKVAPYGVIRTGDVVLVKRSGGPIVGRFVAGTVLRYNVLTVETMKHIRREFGKRIGATDDAFWVARAGKRYGTLIDVVDPREVEPRTIEKRDRRGWVVLGDANIENDLMPKSEMTWIQNTQTKGMEDGA